MKLQLTLFCLLCVTPVFLYPSTEKRKDGEVSVNGDVGKEGSRTSLAAGQTTKKQSVKQANLRRNQLGGPRKRPAASGKRRPAQSNNAKKGVKKSKSSPIKFFPRSEMTDQLNQVMDDTFLIYSKQLANKTFNLKVRNIDPELKIQPWAYLVKKSGEEESERRTKRENAAAEDVKVKTEDAEDQDQDDDQDDQDEDDDEDEIDEDAFNQQFPAVNSTDRSDNANGFSFSLTPQPLPAGDKSVEYNFQLLSTADMGVVQDVKSSDSDDPATARTQRKSKGKFQSAPKRPNAVVEGLEKIQRMGDVLVGTKNETDRIFDVPIQVGPIRFVMKNTTDLELRNSHVESPLLTARLRLTERDGKIVMARIKPTRIHRSRAVVTAVLGRRSAAPNKRESARMVTHLSKEMARIWNTGYLLRSTGRRFKDLINNNGTQPVDMKTSLPVQ